MLRPTNLSSQGVKQNLHEMQITRLPHLLQVMLQGMHDTAL